MEIFLKNLSIWGTQLVLEVGDSKEYVFHKQIVVIGSRNKIRPHLYFGCYFGMHTSTRTYANDSH